MKEANYIIQVRIKQFYCGSAELFSDILLNPFELK